MAAWGLAKRLSLFGTSLVLFGAVVMVPVKALEITEGATSASFSLLDPGIYEIVNETVPGAFMIDVLGNLYLTGIVDIDYETAPVHHVVYRKLGMSVPSVTSTITVTVKDSNDNAPAFEHDLYLGAVNAKYPDGSTLVTIRATDADGMPPNNQLDFYAIESGNINNTFTVNGSGQVHVTLGKETTVTEVPLYSLTVIAVDRGIMPLTGTTTIIIRACGV